MKRLGVASLMAMIHIALGIWILVTETEDTPLGVIAFPLSIFSPLLAYPAFGYVRALLWLGRDIAMMLQSSVIGVVLAILFEAFSRFRYRQK